MRNAKMLLGTESIINKSVGISALAAGALQVFDLPLASSPLSSGLAQCCGPGLTTEGGIFDATVSISIYE